MFSYFFTSHEVLGNPLLAKVRGLALFLLRVLSTKF